MMLKSGLPAIVLALLLNLLFAQPAHAYLDPGSVSLFLQSIIAVFLGALFVLRSHWHGFKAKVRGLFRGAHEGDGSEAPASPVNQSSTEMSSTHENAGEGPDRP
ncbi:MAG: hypothetical protein AAFY88_28020 [Acidobacteriota bacterium]